MKERIRAVMDYAQMTQQDFAARIGISPASLSNIFTGRTNPTQKQVMAIHGAFPEINVSWLMFGEGEMILSSPMVDNRAAQNNELQGGVMPTSQTAIEPAPMSSQGHSLFDAEPVLPQHVVSESPRPSYSPRREVHNAYRPNAISSQMAINIDKQARKIKEIRVFFDDGTYESFVPSSK